LKFTGLVVSSEQPVASPVDGSALPQKYLTTHGRRGLAFSSAALAEPKDSKVNSTQHQYFQSSNLSSHYKKGKKGTKTARNTPNTSHLKS
jgi:hypothetical protein